MLPGRGRYRAAADSIDQGSRLMRVPDSLRRTVNELSDVLADLEGRVTGKGTSRQRGARKAATTRKRTATRPMILPVVLEI